MDTERNGRIYYEVSWPSLNFYFRENLQSEHRQGMSNDVY
jgi:hypothetical protein